MASTVLKNTVNSRRSLALGKQNHHNIPCSLKFTSAMYSLAQSFYNITTPQMASLSPLPSIPHTTNDIEHHKVQPAPPVANLAVERRLSVGKSHNCVDEEAICNPQIAHINSQSVQGNKRRTVRVGVKQQIRLKD
jgi:hypothetical protein